MEMFEDRSEWAARWEVIQKRTKNFNKDEWKELDTHVNMMVNLYHYDDPIVVYTDTTGAMTQEYAMIIMPYIEKYLDARFEYGS